MDRKNHQNIKFWIFSKKAKILARSEDSRSFEDQENKKGRTKEREKGRRGVHVNLSIHL